MKNILKKIIIISFVPILIIIWIISPIIKIRWSKKDYFSDRIGHLVSEMEHYLHLKKGSEKNIIDLFPKSIFYNKQPSNFFLQKHYRKKIVTINDKILRTLRETQKLVEEYLKISNYENFDRQLSTRDRLNIFNKNFKPSIEFSKVEISTINKSLKKIGIKNKQKFVCIVIRDDKYLKKKIPHLDYSYHDYRDSEINDYINAIKFLIKKGYFVLRMGKSQKKKMIFKDKKFCDYAFSNLRSDLLDVWLMSNCEFCLSTGTGLDQISRVFNKPIFFVNHLPLIDWSSHCKSITYPKFLFDKNKKRYLKVEEYIKHSYFRKDMYDKKGIKIVDLGKKEILQGVQEFCKIHENKWKISKTYKEQQTKFKSRFLKNLSIINPTIDYHRNINKYSFISLNFLKNKKLS